MYILSIDDGSVTTEFKQVMNGIFTTQKVSRQALADIKEFTDSYPEVSGVVGESGIIMFDGLCLVTPHGVVNKLQSF